MIIRATDPMVSVYLLPYFMENDMHRIDIGTELFDRMTFKPDETLVLLSLEGINVMFFLVAYKTEDSVFIWQARANGHCEENKQILDAATEWSKSIGVNKLAFSSPRAKAICRRWGFVQDGELAVKEI
jgi:hypothetical protein